MTVTNTTSRTSALPGNGVTTSFSFSPMVIYESTDLQVIHTVTATGVSTVLSEGASSSTYSVDLTSYPGTGSITYPAVGGTPIPSTETITMIRAVPITQSVDLTAQGPYNPETQETALDRITIIASQLAEKLSRAIVLPIGSASGFTGNDAIPVAGGYLKMASDLGSVSWTTLSTSDASASDTASEDVSLTAASAGSATDFARQDHVHLLPTVSVAKGGTGAATAQAGFEALAPSSTDNAITRYDGTAGYIQDSGWTISDGDVMAAGGRVDMGDEVLDQPTIRDYAESTTAIGSIGGGTQDLNIELGNVFSGTVDTSTTTFTFSNPSPTGSTCSLTLVLTNGGSQTVNWPAAVDWAGGAAPTLTTAGVDVLSFFTMDAGTIWYGFTSGLDMK